MYGNKQLIVCVCACVLCLHAVETKLFVDLSSESSFFDGTILSGMRNIGCQGFNKKNVIKVFTHTVYISIILHRWVVGIASTQIKLNKVTLMNLNPFKRLRI